jgi:hypothetical protein
LQLAVRGHALSGLFAAGTTLDDFLSSWEPLWYMVELHTGVDIEIPAEEEAEITCLDQAPEDAIQPFSLMSWESFADKNGDLHVGDATVEDALNIVNPGTVDLMDEETFYAAAVYDSEEDRPLLPWKKRSCKPAGPTFSLPQPEASSTTYYDKAFLDVDEFFSQSGTSSAEETLTTSQAPEVTSEGAAAPAAATGQATPPMFAFTRTLTADDEAATILAPSVPLHRNMRWKDSNDWCSWECTTTALPPMVTVASLVGPSTIINGGLGVRAAERTPPGSMVGDYRGRERHYRTAQALRATGSHLWCYTVWRGINGRIIDGKPDEYMPVETMIKFGSIASLINTHPSLKPEANNCTFQRLDENYQLHPRSGFMDVRIVAVTNRWVEEGEEFTVWLGDDIAARIKESRSSWPEFQAFMAEYEQYWGRPYEA